MTKQLRPFYGCGTRKAGGIYSVGLKHEEMEQVNLKFRDFIIDPPWLIEPSQIGLAAQGVRILPRPDGSNIYDIYDWVGEGSYPYVPDFIQEADQLEGTSRLVAKETPNLAMLTPDPGDGTGSRHFFGFPKGLVTYYDSLYEDYLHILECPTKNATHNSDEKMFCTGLLWECIGKHGKADYPIGKGRIRTVSMPRIRGVPISFTYLGALKPELMPEDWQFAFCYWQPIPRFEVVIDEATNLHELAIKVLEESGCQIPFILKEE